MTKYYCELINVRFENREEFYLFLILYGDNYFFLKLFCLDFAKYVFIFTFRHLSVCLYYVNITFLETKVYYYGIEVHKSPLINIKG